MLLASVWTALLLVATTEPDYTIDQAPPEGLWLSAQAGAGVIGGDVAGGVSLGVGVETQPFALHLRAPVVFRLVDLPPASGGSTSVTLPSSCRVIRCEEWLEGGELSPDALTRVIDELRVLRPGDVFHLRGGPLFVTLGHGQLVSRYTNAADWDRRRSGLYAESNLPWGLTQVQALTGGIFSPQELFGARAAVSPLYDTDDEELLDRFLGRLRLGVEAAGDLTAPLGQATDVVGDVRPGSASTPLVGLAADLAWPLFDDPAAGEGGGVQLEPWIGASVLSGLRNDEGRGLGAGGAAGLEGTVDLIVVALRAGIRLLVDGPRHRSALFSTLYDVDRRRFLDADGIYAPVGVAELAAPGGVGGAGSLEVLVLRVVKVGARLHLDPVPEATQAELFAEVAAGPVRVAARALQRAFTDVESGLRFGDHTYVVAEATWAVLPPVSLFARWHHTPRFKSGALQADDDVFIGASFDLVLQAPGPPSP